MTQVWNIKFSNPIYCKTYYNIEWINCILKWSTRTTVIMIHLLRSQVFYFEFMSLKIYWIHSLKSFVGSVGFVVVIVFHVWLSNIAFWCVSCHVKHSPLVLNLTLVNNHPFLRASIKYKGELLRSVWGGWMWYSIIGFWF